MLPASLAQRILQRFPGKLSYCFAYGSGVKRQVGYDDKAQKDAMIDLVMCVDNAYDWHAENLKKNPNDYSWMRHLGPNLIADYQTYAAAVYCNTLIRIDEYTSIKYGVITTEDLSDDLYHWLHLYIAGRLQKPVETLVKPNDQLKSDLQKNYINALHTALLQLPEEFTYFELFHAIANISYTGDVRMYFGEKKDKVKNIVEPQLGTFLELYKEQLQQLSHCVHVPDLSKVCDSKIKQNKSYESIVEHFEALPTNLHKMMSNKPVSELASNPEYRKILDDAIRAINHENSLTQSLKNIPSAGFSKAVVYGSRKAMKTFSK